ncbi:DNA-binding response OmpR family regulator [Halanaerobium saccharolyticum]|uniref:Stage 0 sporulation protein A homolog n=1 Tax=Halanaerobium saccharolyticum TaxID=43595 RepID=A0A4R7Z7N9_9FIRM|nr:response regulator transcription factor [Halanaerobium saccharolyticum]RAK11185.1 DNA-binding response OmpR family regulator [Halanaerobium saccharolyticum]TDW07036.1 DNA-binding response OmpR family regulator [Halanaerobium saccharolyticum]TDX63801.1 DNA-binding response OmpR family regulator [Halanaerobium saccharolyticum]
MEKILVVEDEAKIRKIIRSYLKEDYEISEAVNGQEGLELFKDSYFDLIILDLMLPEISGEKVCQKIRQISEIPIIMLTAKSSEQNKIEGFNYGADDYLTKPFSPRELLVRTKAILRRSRNQEKAGIIILNDGEYKIYHEEMIVKKDNSDCQLTSTEFKILMVLINNAGQVLSREQLADKVMGLEFSGFDRTIDVHIKNIRKKMQLEKDQYIVTVYGAGYKFTGDI